MKTWCPSFDEFRWSVLRSLALLSAEERAEFRSKEEVESYIEIEYKIYYKESYLKRLKTKK